MCLLGYQRSLRVERMGRVPYGPMTRLQESRHAEVLAHDVDDTLFLLEHEPVVTLGKNTGEGHVLETPAALEARGIELVRASRGGDVTYHGPGQLVGYPVIELQDEERDIRRYVTMLEELLIRTAADFGVDARRVEGLRGIWVGNAKLAAIGVRVARWVTMHGFALNVSTNLDDFGVIVPCGLHGRSVTSLERLLGRAVDLAEVEERLLSHVVAVFDRRPYAAAPTPLPVAHFTHEVVDTAVEPTAEVRP